MQRQIINNKIREPHNKEKVTCAKDIYEIMKRIYDHNNIKEQEAFYVLGLNADNKIKLIELSELGTVNCAYPIMREILKTILLNDCASIIVTHNHPSGNITPSKEDNIFTQSLKDACKVIGITFLDHLILGDGFYSYCNA